MVIKYLYFKTSDGETWKLPKLFIAEHRARHYANRDKDTTFESEVNYVMGDNYEANDWMRNNMNTEDYEKAMIQVKGPDNIPFLDKFEDDDRKEMWEQEDEC
jgi:hypothetical protein